jgi:hypothetical protein
MVENSRFLPSRHFCPPRSQVEVLFAQLEVRVACFLVVSFQIPWCIWYIKVESIGIELRFWGGFGNDLRCCENQESCRKQHRESVVRYGLGGSDLGADGKAEEPSRS